MGKIVYLTTDLMFASRIQGGQADCDIVANVDLAIERLQAHPSATVILDLSTPGFDVAVAVPRLRCAGAGRIIAYAPHVHVSRLESAKTAGCDEVFTRGQFNSRMQTLGG